MTKYSETLTKQEAMNTAGLAYTVEARPIYDNNGAEIKSHKMLTRQDTGAQFGIVSSRYQPFQNDQLFSLVDQFLETGAAKYANARAWKDGAKVSARVCIPDASFDVLPGDKCAGYLDIGTSHDGTGSIYIRPLVYRLVCRNGLHLWKEDSVRSINVRHVKSAADRLLISARELLNAEIEYFREFNRKMKELAGKDFDSLRLDSFLNELLELDEQDIGTGRYERQKYAIKRLVKYGTGQDIEGVRGTAYAVFNGVTEYVTHYQTKDIRKREYSELYGSGADLRERAYALLTR